MIDASGQLHERSQPQELATRSRHPQDRGRFHQTSLDIPKYSRMVSVEEIVENGVQPQLATLHRQPDSRGRTGHHGPSERRHIPVVDVEALGRAIGPFARRLKSALFKANRPKYLGLAVEKSSIKSAVYKHPEFATFIEGMNGHF